ncbi:MAG: glycosyltransferase family 4 protein [Gemmataceae bacterium]
MRLIALVDAPDHVCCRYRIEAFRAAWQRRGHSLQLVCPPPHWRRWPETCWELARGDVLIVQRRLLSPLLLQALRRLVSKLVFDFDDAIFMNDSYDRRGPEAPARRRRFAALVLACDAVVAGNPFLRQIACRWASPERVRVIPTCVDPYPYVQAEHFRKQGVELVWIGSASTLQGLERCRELLEEIGRRIPGLRLRLICDRFIKLRHVEVCPQTWSPDSEAEGLARADIGISWLPDDRWSRGKCGLKILQYMAAGLPTVANPVGVQAEFVRHGETGFLAATAQEWCRAIHRLAADPALRQRQGQRARLLCLQHHSVEVGAHRWLDLLSDLSGSGRLTQLERIAS